MATFITSKPVGQTIRIQINTSTGYWKYNHDGTDSNIFISGNDQNITVENANGEFTIISCDITGNPSGDITSMILGSFFGAQDNRITSFDGTGLTGLTNLSLPYNQITSLDNFIFPSSLTTLNLSYNQLTSFNGTGLTSLLALYITHNQLTSVNVSALTNLTRLELGNNQLTSIDVSPLTNLTNLFVNNNLLDSADNNLILSQLVANGKNNGNASTSGGRTSAGTNDFMTLQSRNWFLSGFDDNTTTTTTAAPTTTTTTTSAPTTTTTTTSTPTTTTTTTSTPTTTTTTTSTPWVPGPPPSQPVTFVTSRLLGQMITVNVNTTSGYFRLYHNGLYSSVFSNGAQNITVQNVTGEFTIISCDITGNPSGDISYLVLDYVGLTLFNGIGLSNLTYLSLIADQLTSIDVSPLTNLNNLVLSNNQLTSIDVSTLSNLTGLNVSGNLLDSADNDLILAQLVANGKNSGYAQTTGGRTSAGTNDFNTLQSRGWFLIGFSVTTTTTTAAPTTTTTTTLGPTISRKLRIKGINQI